MEKINLNQNIPVAKITKLFLKYFSILLHGLILLIIVYNFISEFKEFTNAPLSEIIDMAPIFLIAFAYLFISLYLSIKYDINKDKLLKVLIPLIITPVLIVACLLLMGPQ